MYKKLEDFHSWCVVSHLPQQCIKAPFATYPHQYLDESVIPPSFSLHRFSCTVFDEKAAIVLTVIPLYRMRLSPRDLRLSLSFLLFQQLDSDMPRYQFLYSTWSLLLGIC